MRRHAALFVRTLAFALALITSCSLLAADTLYEFYNTALNHYFLTIDPAEAAAIDGGAAGPGWQRTGKIIYAFRSLAAAPATAVVVCRFYGNQAMGGPNGHFYTAVADECAQVRLDPGWTFERNEFFVQIPVGGTCPSGSLPVYRSYNGRFAQRDSNHRYTTDLSTYNQMTALGWTAEGVVFCGAGLQPVSVAAQLDTNRAVSATISRAGGTLSVTGADGTVFTLTLPDGALLSDAKITMTPVSSVDRLPLSGGLVAAVQLTPEGLQLFQPAALVISPPTVVPVAQEITFAWRGTGEEFFLYPPEPVGTAAISLTVFHFSGYGVGRGSRGDVDVQLTRPPTSADDQLDQDLQGPAAEQRKALRTGAIAAGASARRVPLKAQTPAQILATIRLNDFLVRTLAPLQPHSCSEKWPDFLAMLVKFKHRVLALTGGDPALLAAAQSHRSSLLTLLKGCYDKAYDLCRNDKNPAQGEEMLRLWNAFFFNELNVGVDEGKIAKCLTFELKFFSFFEEPPVPNLAGATLIFRHTVTATLPMITFGKYGAAEGFSGDLKYRSDVTWNPGDSKCNLSVSTAPHTFLVRALFLDVNLYRDNPETRTPLTMIYDPGRPEFTFGLTCPGVTQQVTAPRWREAFELHHAPAFSTFFEATDWTKVGGSDPYAFKRYESRVYATELTEITLNHTPQ